jgi:nanoRNase/pAp phosphatase (c-di-AMP/oligoRNAs hydrolase)
MRTTLRRVALLAMLAIAAVYGGGGHHVWP